MNAQDVMASIDARLNEGVDSAAKVNEFLINRDQEETNLTLDYAKQILALEIEIKEIKNDIKEMRADAKANGVAVQKVNKVIANLKKLAKTNDKDISEMETIEGVLMGDVDIRTMITTLTKKD